MQVLGNSRQGHVDYGGIHDGHEHGVHVDDADGHLVVDDPIRQ